MRKDDFSAAAARFATSLLLLIVAATFAGCQSTAEHTADRSLVVKLVAFNDFHGHLNPHGATSRAADPGSPGKTLDLPTGGVAYLASLVSQLKATNSFTTVVGAGDMIGGAPLVSSLFHHEPSIEALNRLGLEFSSVGNHEFDAGRAELLRMQKGGCFPGADAETCRNGEFTGAQFRYLAANVIDRATGRSFLPGYAVKKYASAGGRSVEIAFIGLVLEGTPGLVLPSGIEGLDFIDEADAANALVPELRARGIESIVVLIHEGGYTAQAAFDDTTCPDFKGPILQIMDRLDPAIDVVVSGHTHRAYICRHGGRLVTSAGSEGRIVTDIDLTIDTHSGNIVDAGARQLAVVNDTATNPLPQAYPTVAADNRMRSILDLYNTAAAPLAQREVGRITQEMPRAATESGESMLGDVIADAQLAATSTTQLGGSQIAFMNDGGIRTDLRGSQGLVSYSDAFSIHPFGNGLITLSLTGAQIDKLLEQQWTHSGSQLQVSKGFSYEWNAGAPLGQRVDMASIRLHGVPLDPAKTYRVTVNEFLAQGGDGYSVLIEGTDRVRGVTDVQALTNYLAENSPLAPPAIGRVRKLH